MPTYVYKCDACGNQFEHFQSFKEAPLDTCECGQSGKVRRVFQPVGIVFKGSGWYINDSRTNKSTKTSDAGDKSDSTTSSDTSSDTKKSSTPASDD